MVIVVKDDNKVFDKLDVVKKYFARIFTILSKDTRDGINKLNVDDQQRKEIKDEISFLPKNKQRDFLKELTDDED
jgi:hypothetical protein